jgi:glutathione S-transferase
MSDDIIVHGLTPSYFTRKVTGYLDYKQLRWRLRGSLGLHRAARAAGWNGGIPVVETPTDGLIWDSTAVILHLEHRHPTPSIRPPDPALAFLGWVIEDFSDEWLYRHAVGARWLFPENATTGSWDIAREGAVETGFGLVATRALASAAMTACLPRLGVTPENIQAWLDDSLLPWQRLLGAHARLHGWVLGGRPSIADFALFGANVAHFVGDPLCAEWTEAAAPDVVAYTLRMETPTEQSYGDWLEVRALPDTLLALLAETGRHYLPWVAQATRAGTAVVRFESGPTAEIATTNFLDVARGQLLARYVAARTPALDAVLERAGILRWFAPYTDQATSVPDPALPPRPADNQPFRAGP